MKATVAIVLLAVSTAAQGDEFVCSFASGTAAALEGAKWTPYERAQESAPMMFTFVAMSADNLRKMLDGARKAKDAEGVRLAEPLVDRAKVTGFAGWVEGADGYSSPLSVIRGEGSATFIETTATGNVTTTTLFLIKRTPDGRIPAVHSRHMTMQGAGMVSQYTGGCMRK